MKYFAFCCLFAISVGAKDFVGELSNIANNKIEKILINVALDRTNGKKNEAAKLLGWGRNTLAKKMKEMGIGG